jgi:putative ABC transport system substrate-binding protein
LSETGFVERQNVTVEYRWADHQPDRLPELLADLVRRQVAVIVTLGSVPVARIAKATTTSIPIVFEIGNDPVRVGFVTSLNRPGGNITGVTTLNVEIGPKRLELLHELVPATSVIALLVNPTNPNAETLSRDMQAAARNPPAKSTRPSRISRNYKPVGSLSDPIHSSVPAKASLAHSLSTALCPRSITIESLSRPAAL